MPRSRGSYRKSGGDKRYSENRCEEPCADNFEVQLQHLNNMSVAHLKVMVRLAAQETFSQHQSAVLAASLHRLFAVEPREVQLRVVRRLVYSVGDTLLIARTGFGKSLTFQAYCALTDKIAIQLVPLSKLGHQQAVRMARIAGARVCLITAETLEQDHRLLMDVERCKYNHILLGPEQAVAPRFRRILRDPDFAKSVGVVIVDECHVLSTWGTFRESVTHIRELRLSLPSRVRMYGCTATLTEEQEKEALLYGGFRHEGDALEDLCIIRVGIDRPEIKIRVRPIERAMSMSYRQLYFVLHGAVQDTTTPKWFQFGRVLPVDLEKLPIAQRRLRFRRTPRRIPKTIIFVDGISKIDTVVELIRQWLQELGYPADEAAEVVCSYSSHTSRFDQDAIIAEFEKPESNIRIIAATSAIGIGMDIGDVAVVVQFGLPLGEGIDELWQRWGRLARSLGSVGTGVLFAPYWLFDCMGRFSPQNPTLKAAALAAEPVSHHQRGKSRVHESRQDARDMQRRTISLPRTVAISSRLREQHAAASDGATSDEGIECGGVSSTVDADLDVMLAARRNARTKPGEIPFWNSDDIRLRSKTPSIWPEVCNGVCCRKPILRELRDHLSELDSRQPPAVGENCCNGLLCGPELTAANEAWSIAGVHTVVVRRPTRRSKRRYSILLALEQWVGERAAAYAQNLRLWCAAPSIAVMSERTAVLLATALSDDRVRDCKPQSLMSIEKFRELAPVVEWMGELRSLLHWRVELNVEDLVEQLMVDAREWMVFRWHEVSATEADNAAAAAPTTTDVARRQAQLAAVRREQQELEAELECAVLDLERRGASQELRDRVVAVIMRTRNTREQRENLEFYLAAGRTRELETTDVVSPQVERRASTSLASPSVVRPVLGEINDDVCAAGEVNDDVGATGDEEFAIPAISRRLEGSVTGDCDSREDRQRTTPSAAGRPTTPDVATSGKRPLMTPKSGRRGRKKKVQRRVEASVDGSDTDAGRSDISSRSTYTSAALGVVGSKWSGRERTMSAAKKRQLEDI
jgi:superfamily II DNA or RNA helicase